MDFLPCALLQSCCLGGAGTWSLVSDMDLRRKVEVIGMLASTGKEKTDTDSIVVHTCSLNGSFQVALVGTQSRGHVLLFFSLKRLQVEICLQRYGCVLAKRFCASTSYKRILFRVSSHASPVSTCRPSEDRSEVIIMVSVKKNLSPSPTWCQDQSNFQLQNPDLISRV